MSSILKVFALFLVFFVAFGMSNPVPKINDEVLIDGTPLSPACPLCTHKMRGTPLPTDVLEKFGPLLPTDAANFGPDGTPLPTDDTF